MANIIHNSFKRDIANGSIDLDSDTIKAMLVIGYTPDNTAKRTHTKRSDVTSFEIASGGGYTTGGVALANKTVTVDNVNDRGVFDADDLAWSGTLTASGLIIYKSRGGASSADELVGFWDFGSSRTSTGGAFTVSWNAAGILTIP